MYKRKVWLLGSHGSGLDVSEPASSIGEARGGKSDLANFCVMTGQLFGPDKLEWHGL